jgi:DNA-binding NarL/FixJ family response regulator
MRILLCDDTPELRALLRSALEARKDVRVVGEVGDGHRALECAAQEQPDVVVLDLEMPGPAADVLLAELRRAAPTTAIVTFSGHDPADVAGPAMGEIALHVPKTTDLSAAARAVWDIGGNHYKS